MFFRAILEFLIPILVLLVARAMFGSLIKGFGAAASSAFQNQQQQRPGQAETPKETSRAGELHKDPVCGTYVSESTSFRRQLSGKTVYYCSDACRQKHAV
jgi:YHS domain-containing protein